MRNAQVAEWLLSLVTTPLRAASTVGDLMENAARRGVVRFWIGVLRTAFSMMWRDVTASPARMARLAGGGFIVGLALLFVCFFPVFPIAILLSPAGFRDPSAAFNSRIFNVASMAVILLVPFQQGRWLARRSPGQELAACFALTILTAAVDSLPMALGLGTAFQLMLSIAASIPMFAGAVWVRRKRMTR